MKTLTGSSSMVTPSRLSDKMASRNGPRRSVYWVQCRREDGSSSSSSTGGGGGARKTSMTADLAAGAGRVTYSVTGKYTGDWKDGLKHGYGVFVYANGSKYEGEWVDDLRQGKGTYWVNSQNPQDNKNKNKTTRKQYAGDWQNDQRHGMGTCFFDDGSRYDGLWERNKRQGTGRKVYSDQAVYDGQWHHNQRSGHGVFVLANGDRYDGHWLHDKKEGPGRFYYKATRKLYEGEWVDDSPRCGTYHDVDKADQEDDEADQDDAKHDDSRGFSKPHDQFQVPELGLAHPERVVSESIANIRQERIMEKAFQSHHLHLSGEHDEEDDGAAGRRLDEEADAGGGGGSVVFDEATMKLLQYEFQSIERRDGTIQCEVLPHMLHVLGLQIENDQILAFLNEIGASPETSISFAECVDMVSLLAESTMGDVPQQDDGDDEYEDGDGDEEEEDE